MMISENEQNLNNGCIQFLVESIKKLLNKDVGVGVTFNRRSDLFHNGRVGEVFPFI